MCFYILQRGRDHGLADYNTVREAYGLGRKRSFLDINPNYNREVFRLHDYFVNLSSFFCLLMSLFICTPCYEPGVTRK